MTQVKNKRRTILAESMVPRYLQVASALRSRIRQGHWAVGDRITTIEKLEEEFQVARVTVRQAIDILQSEGLVRSYQGKGTFVTDTVSDDRWLQLATDWDALIKPIRGNVPQHLTVTDEFPPSLQEEDGEPAKVYKFLHSVQLREKEPFAIACVYLAKEIYDMAPMKFRRRVALSVVAEMETLEISRAHQTLTIGTADLETGRQLNIALNAPTVEARCVVTDAQDTVIYLGEITYRGDCVRLNIELLDRNGD